MKIKHFAVLDGLNFMLAYRIRKLYSLNKIKQFPREIKKARHEFICVTVNFSDLNRTFTRTTFI